MYLFVTCDLNGRRKLLNRNFVTIKQIVRTVLPNIQNVVTDKGKHTAAGEQHELTMHIEVFDAQV